MLFAELSWAERAVKTDSKTLLTLHRPQGSENHTRIPPTILKLIKKKKLYHKI